MPTRFEQRRQLFELAATEGGYFTAAQARAIGYDRRTLWYHVRTKHFERESRGFYRFVEFPAQSHEGVIAAWLKAGAARAVVSHETALADGADREVGLHPTIKFNEPGWQAALIMK